MSRNATTKATSLFSHFDLDDDATENLANKLFEKIRDEASSILIKIGFGDAPLMSDQELEDEDCKKIYEYLILLKICADSESNEENKINIKSAFAQALGSLAKRLEDHAEDLTNSDPTRKIISIKEGKSSKELLDLCDQYKAAMKIYEEEKAKKASNKDLAIGVVGFVAASSVAVGIGAAIAGANLLPFIASAIAASSMSLKDASTKIWQSVADSGTYLSNSQSEASESQVIESTQDLRVQSSINTQSYTNIFSSIDPSVMSNAMRVFVTTTASLALDMHRGFVNFGNIGVGASEVGEVGASEEDFDSDNLDSGNDDFIGRNIVKFFIRIGVRDTFNTLIYASERGYFDVIELLIEKGEDVNIVSENGWSALHIAASKGNIKAVKNLIAAGVDINLVHKDGWNALHFAIEKGHIEVAKILIDAIAKKNPSDLNTKNGNGDSALIIALQKGFTEITDKLIENGAHLLDGSETALHTLIALGKIEAAKDLIEAIGKKNPSDLNIKNGNGHAALYIAAEKGLTEIVETLIQNGADYNVTENYGWTPLHLAVFYEKTEIVKILIEAIGRKNQSDFNAKDKLNGYTTLHLASTKGFIETTILLIENGADLNALDKNGWTPLHLAVNDGKIEIAKTLIEAIAKKNRSDLNIKNGNGHPALIIALEKGFIEIAELLIENGAHLPIGESETPLHTAIALGKTEVARYLIEKIGTGNSLDLGVKNQNGDTTLMIAAEKGFTEIVSLLIKKGVPLDAVNKNGYTALHVAAKENKINIAEILIENGCDVNIKNANGETPLHIAITNGNEEIAKFLIERIFVEDIDAFNKEPYRDVPSIIHKKYIDEKDAQKKVFYKNEIDLMMRMGVPFEKEKYKTVIYSGPRIVDANIDLNPETEHLKFLRHDILNGQIITDADIAVIYAHGNILGQQEVLQGDKGTVQADDFAAEYFPNAKIIHAIGCSIGGNVKNNFGANSLSPGQTLFLHAGSEVIPYASTISSFFASKPNTMFPVSNPVKIIHKNEDNSNSVIELFPITIRELRKLIKDNNKDTVNEIYSALRNRISWQLKLASSKLPSASKQAQEDISLELEKLGFRDYPENANEIVKKTLVKNYLGNLVIGFSSVNHNEGDVALNSFDALIKQGVLDLDVRLHNNRTPLYLAAEERSKELVEFLIKRKANPNIVDEINGNSPITVAVFNRDAEIVRILIEAGADLNRPTNDGRRPIDIAIDNGDIDMANLLIESGADLDANAQRVHTFHAAIQKGHQEIAKALIKAIAKRNPENLNVENEDGKSALDIATEKGLSEVMQDLIENMAVANTPQKNSSATVDIPTRTTNLPDKKNPKVWTTPKFDKAKNKTNVLERLTQGGRNLHLEDESDQAESFAGNKDAAEILSNHTQQSEIPSTSITKHVAKVFTDRRVKKYRDGL